jgi:hypothetical protein
MHLVVSLLEVPKGRVMPQRSSRHQNRRPWPTTHQHFITTRRHVRSKPKQAAVQLQKDQQQQQQQVVAAVTWS